MYWGVNEVRRSLTLNIGLGCLGAGWAELAVVVTGAGVGVVT